MIGERSDEELLQAIVAQNVEALEALYERYGRLAFSLASRVTGSPENAEEVVQESFLAVWRRGSSYSPARGSVHTWILGIVHHRAIDVIRARRAWGPAVALDDDLPLAGHEDVWRDVERNLDREAILRALAQLPREQRQSIALAYFGGLSYPEIAGRLGVPLGTIKSRMRLGLEKLRGLLTEPTRRGAQSG